MQIVSHEESRLLESSAILSEDTNGLKFSSSAQDWNVFQSPLV